LTHLAFLFISNTRRRDIFAKRLIGVEQLEQKQLLTNFVEVPGGFGLFECFSGADTQDSLAPVAEIFGGQEFDEGGVAPHPGADGNASIGTGRVPDNQTSLG
jgi:hypothetical protein